MTAPDRSRAPGPGSAPEGTRGDLDFSRIPARAQRLQERWWPKVLMYSVLAVMTFGDAYGIFLTLIDLIQQDEDLVRLFTFALTLGAVAGAHEIGRLTRSRREGRDGNPVWIAALAIFWLSVGGGIAWLRSTQPLSSRDEVAGLESVQFGLLLLGLFLLTGALAMTTAYRYGSPRAAELKAMLAERKRALRDANDHHYDRRHAEAKAQHVAAQRQQINDELADGEVHQALGQFLKARARYQQAGYAGDPQATDDLIPPPGPPSGQNWNR